MKLFLAFFDFSVFYCTSQSIFVHIMAQSMKLIWDTGICGTRNEGGKEGLVALWPEPPRAPNLAEIATAYPCGQATHVPVTLKMAC